jgi:uncharacterized protein YpmB
VVEFRSLGKEFNIVIIIIIIIIIIISYSYFCATPHIMDWYSKDAVASNFCLDSNGERGGENNLDHKLI